MAAQAFHSIPAAPRTWRQRFGHVSSTALCSGKRPVWSRQMKKPSMVAPQNGPNGPMQDKGSKALYKRPSIAIEKGGGFYIPGLEGPRLRIFIGTVAGLLLTWNHSSGPGLNASWHTLLSESVAALAALSLLSIAFKQMNAPAVPSAQSSNAQNVSAGATPVADTDANSSGFDEGGIPLNIQPMSRDSTGTIEQWLVESVVDLTIMDCCAIVKEQADQAATVSGNVGRIRSLSAGEDLGEVIRRVKAEGQSLYLDNLSTLPPGVDIPFVVNPECSAFVVPVGKGDDRLLVALGPVTASTDATLSRREREWIETVTQEILQTAS
ncbi:hypothetical protein FVE85_4078 [Porphyridium purpureum]|uniref:Uncharacterized protein n=1 Tax=Porphyridium purpureum TaxID=35688 RepID=A0A5J4YTL2_PORPP|nr:hypothetical protein FVE85_4078 [Porphyridium purpureum]|eukprot:POR8533..scf229_5